MLDRLYTTQKFFGVSQEKLSEIFESPLGVFNFFTAEYNSRELDSALRPERHPNTYKLSYDVLQDLLNSYTQYALPEKLSYRLDYFFVGPREEEMDIDGMFLHTSEKIYENSEVEIYKIIPK